MTGTIGIISRHRLPAGLTAGVILAASVALGAYTGSASAQERWRHDRGYHHNWNGGYYRAPPPVYYGAPRYYPPPVVYGPGVGLNFNFR